MIFVTVGVQLPFDRLIRAIDVWAGERARSDIVAQVGASSYRPANIQAKAQFSPDAFRAHVEEATLVVAHAGMGSIITALEMGKPIIVLPRQAALNEHRNDHQLATARYMEEQKLVRVAKSEDDLVRLLDDWQDSVPPESAPPVRIAQYAESELVARLSAFIAESAGAGREKRRSPFMRLFRG